MKATINVSVRIPAAQARIIRRAAEARHMKLATYIRDAAVRMAQQVMVEQAIVKRAVS